jgi:hypothetical protein
MVFMIRDLSSMADFPAQATTWKNLPSTLPTSRLTRIISQRQLVKYTPYMIVMTDLTNEKVKELIMAENRGISHDDLYRPSVMFASVSLATVSSVLFAVGRFPDALR